MFCILTYIYLLVSDEKVQFPKSDTFCIVEALIISYRIVSGNEMEHVSACSSWRGVLYQSDNKIFIFIVYNLLTVCGEIWFYDFI